MLGGLAIKLGLQHNVVHTIVALVGDPSNRSEGAGVEHDLMVADQRVFVHGTKDVSSGDMIANLPGNVL